MSGVRYSDVAQLLRANHASAPQFPASFPYLQAVAIAALRAVLDLEHAAHEFSFSPASTVPPTSKPGTSGSAATTATSASAAAAAKAAPTPFASVDLLPPATLRAHVGVMVQALNAHLFDAEAQQFMFAYDRIGGALVVDARLVWSESLTALAFLEVRVCFYTRIDQLVVTLSFVSSLS